MLSIRIFRNIVVGQECFFSWCSAIELVSERCMVSRFDIVEVKPIYIYIYMFVFGNAMSQRYNLPIYYGKFISQFQLDIIMSIRWLDRIKIKICRQKKSILFTQICLNIYIYIYIYIYKLATFVESDPKAPFSIATTLRCRGGRYSSLWAVPLYPRT